MTIQQAEQLIRAYQEVMADDSKRGSRRDPSLLPAPKEKLMQAIKLELAQLFLLNSHTNEDLTKPLINAALFIDSFSELPLEASEFIESMHRRRREVDSFYVELLRLDRMDSFYWQRVYTMLGIDIETKRTTFFQDLRQRFGLGPKPAEGDGFHGRRPVGRLAID
jgi:hypothetical protein